MNNEMKGWTAIVFGLLGLALFMGIPIIMGGFILGALGIASLSFLWLALPLWLRKFLTLPGVRFLVDVAVTLSAPLMLGATITGIFAGIVMGLMATVLLRMEYCRLRGLPVV